MKNKHAAAFIPLFVVGISVFVGWIMGHLWGSKHPEVVWTIHDGYTNAYGWDKANKCVATWTWGAGGGFSWQRLGRLSDLGNALQTPTPDTR